jgi:hypothetical protein
LENVNRRTVVQTSLGINARPYPNNTNQKARGYGLSSRTSARETQGSEFKPQYCSKKK